MNAFNDGIRQIQRNKLDSLVARLGSRLTWHSPNNEKAHFYFSFNLLNTLKGDKSRVQVGSTILEEQYGKLNLELGLDGQYPLTKSLTLYADLHHLHGLNRSNKIFAGSSKTQRGYNGRVGIKYN